MSNPSVSFLPRTSVAAFATSKTEIYTYAQDVNKRLVEVQGSVSADGYSSDKFQTIQVSGMEPARLFTPLAAATYPNRNSNVVRRYVFYIDNNNLLRDVYYESGNWYGGALFKQNCVCAPYSKLSAIHLTNPGGWNFITVYYQVFGDNGPVKLISLNHGTWAPGQPNLDDPPLFGTALAAVPPEPGIESTSGSTTDKDKNRLPVIFFQYNTLGLGSSQDEIAYARWTINENDKSLSAHTGLTAIDDGSNFWCFYISDDNNVQRIRIDSKANITQPQTVALQMKPMPASPLAGVFVKDGDEDYVVLFYLLHYASSDDVPTRTDVYGSALSKTVTADADTWSVSKQTLLTS